MKCEVCLQFLEEYIDGELGEPEAAPLSAHLITCADCAVAFEALTSEQEIYSRYDRELVIAPAMWHEIAARTVAAGRTVESGPRFRWREWFALPTWHGRPARVRAFAGAMAILILALAMGMLYFRTTRPARDQHTSVRVNDSPSSNPQPDKIKEIVPGVKTKDLLTSTSSKRTGNFSRPRATANAGHISKTAAGNQSDVLFSDAAYSMVEERETQQHLEQAQNLLRSVRNIEISEDGSEVDVSYEKAISRRLLNENIVLRRDAEMRGKFPTKIMLSDLEPFLIDIANLPDKPAPDDLRVLKERVLKTEIVAALQGY